MTKLSDDPRIDPRLKALLASIPAMSRRDVTSRDELVAEANSPEALATLEQMKGLFDLMDNEEVAPSTGLDISTREFSSEPDGNTVKVQFIRPRSIEKPACVYYIHGGGMQTMSCFDGMYRAWGRILAQQGVAVAMVDFRNCLTPSSAAEVAPFPAGLDDCVSGVRWLHRQADELDIDQDRITVAGERAAETSRWPRVSSSTAEVSWG